MSVNTWRTFEHALPYFRYFMPMAGSLSSDGAASDEYTYNGLRFFWNPRTR